MRRNGYADPAAVPRWGMATSRFRLVPAVTLLALVSCSLVSCGGGSDPEPQAHDSSSAAAAGLTVEDGITPDDLLDCLEAAGLPVAATDTTPMGVEVPVEGLEVGPLAGGTSGDSEQGADLWVFASSTAAAENRATITLADEDTPTSWVAGNVVVRLFHAAPGDDPQIVSLQDCLPE